MAFEYNGVVYRDLEPQVRYDAEQIQVLKQADVTINENLQTINTEVNGKLTKPANPSAESAVTMLADGTVGTKPLSEIGGKLYLHDITCSGPSGSTMYDVQIKAITDSITPYTYDTYNSLGIYKKAICVQFGFSDSSFNYHYYPTGSLKSAGGITYYEDTISKNFSMYSISNRFADTVTEL